MRVDWMLSATAILLEVTGFILWNTFVGRLERWIWWTVWIGYLILIYHRIGATLGWGGMFGPITSLAIGVVALGATIETNHLLHKRDMARARLIQVREKLAEIQAQPPANMAQRLAEVIVDLKDQIKYYEVQASDAGLPAYEKPANDDAQSGG